MRLQKNFEPIVKAIIVLRPSLNLPVKARRHHLWPFFAKTSVENINGRFIFWKVRSWLVAYYTIRILRPTHPLDDLILFQTDFFGIYWTLIL